jgi:hypothetical protein
MQDLELEGRLAAMEARVPSPVTPPVVARGRRVRRSVSIAAAPLLVFLLAATVVAGGVAVAGLGRGTLGVENPGQPLAGAALECMAPPQAAAYLAAHGFSNVSWQVETGDATGKGGTTTHTATPPDHGYVVPGSIVDGELLMVVDQRSGATGTGAYVGEPMP